MPHAASPEATGSNTTEFNPTAFPDFPSSFPTVELETISIQKLYDHDSVEEQRIFDACKTRGFFYLQLSGSNEGETILNGAGEIAKVGERTSKLGIEEKLRFAPKEGTLFGYKAAGATKADASGVRDTSEFFNVAKNEMILPPSEMQLWWPKTILDEQTLFADYSRAAHSIGLKVLNILSRKLGIDPQEIESRHTFAEPAGDHVRITRGPPRKTADLPEIQTPSHTDFGSITILMNWLGGLQVWSDSAHSVGALEPDTPGEWLWVRPKPGCAIVNLGDAMVKFTNGVLCSGRHRVVPAPGEQGLFPRYSVVYFVRPLDKCRLKTLKGSGVPEVGDEDEEGVEAKEWIRRQAAGLSMKYDG